MKVRNLKHIEVCSVSLYEAAVKGRGFKAVFSCLHNTCILSVSFTMECRSVERIYIYGAAKYNKLLLRLVEIWVMITLTYNGERKKKDNKRGEIVFWL